MRVTAQRHRAFHDERHVVGLSRLSRGALRPKAGMRNRALAAVARPS